MKVIKNYRSLSFLAILLSVGLSLFVIHPNTSAVYNGDNIIDDATFLNANSMSQADIQWFLESKGGGIARQTFYFDCNSTDVSAQYYRYAGAPCQQNVRASAIIYYASQIYGVNPQAVLATMQKEQSLVTAPNPTSWQINQAMGYACPDNGGCGNSNFLYQIDNGVWVQRLNMERARGNLTWWFTSSGWVCGSAKNYYKPSLYPNQSVNFYDDNGVMYRTHYIMNASTASYYCYTPHAYNNPSGLYGLPAYGTTGQYYSGSYNFVRFFEQWFGSTSSGSSPFFSMNSGLYMMGANNTYYSIPNQTIADAYGINSVFGGHYSTGNQAFVSNLTYKGALPWIARFNDNDIFIVTPQGLHQFTSEADYYTYGYSFGQEAILPSYLRGKYTVSNRVYPTATQTDWQRVFTIENGKKRQIVDYMSLSTLGSPVYASRQNTTYPPQYLDTLANGPIIAAPGRIIKATDTGIIYGINTNSSTFQVDPSLLSSWGIGRDFETVNSLVSSLPDSGVRYTSSSIVASPNGTKYLLSNGVKYTVNTTVASSYGLSDQPTSVLPQQLIDRFATKSLGVLVRNINEGAVYIAHGGRLYHIPSEEDLYGLGYTFSDVSVVTTPINHLGTIDPSPFYASGRLIRNSNSPDVYIVTSPLHVAKVPSESLFYAYGYSFADVRVITPGSTSGYTTGPSLAEYISSQAGNKQIVAATCRYTVSPNTLTDFGYNPAVFVALDPKLTAKTKDCGAMTNLVKATNDPKVYKVENGQKRWVPTESTFYQLGYSWTQVRVLSLDTVQAIPTGQPMS